MFVNVKGMVPFINLYKTISILISVLTNKYLLVMFRNKHPLSLKGNVTSEPGNYTVVMNIETALYRRINSIIVSDTHYTDK